MDIKVIKGINRIKNINLYFIQSPEQSEGDLKPSVLNSLVSQQITNFVGEPQKL
ncbi:MAG: hypothetical protein PWP15_61 [Methanothermococcus sp.]|jgi:hypothetical protein|nr:hypothetical protein [Methanothermococcus sp.]